MIGACKSATATSLSLKFDQSSLTETLFPVGLHNCPQSTLPKSEQKAPLLYLA